MVNYLSKLGKVLGPFLLGLCLGSSEGLSQGSDLSTRLRFEVDYGRYRAAGDFVFLEVYYALYRGQLQFVEDNGRYRADFRIHTRIMKGDTLVVEDAWNRVTFANSLSEIKPTQRLADLSAFLIRPGNYKLWVKISDLHSNRFGTIEMPLNLVSFPSDSLLMSDIELASLIRRASEEDIFTKNRYQVIPNPGGLYGTGAPMLYFYTEVYNLEEGEEDSSYEIQYSILDGNGNVVRDYSPAVRKKPGNSAVEVGGINVVSLRSGTYFLRLKVRDNASEQVCSRLKKFFVYRPADFQVAATKGEKGKMDMSIYLSSPEYQIYDQMSEEELDAEFAGSSYIATDEEKRIYGTLNLEGKRSFMKKFWLKRDNNPQTVRNEFRQEYLARLSYVNDHFSAASKAGWKSDRGRVFLIYGRPNEIEAYPSSAENKAYQIWYYYDIQGGVEFIFVDIRGFGDYQLVHSTARDELQDPEWQRWISPY